jgi:hypothetical protein
MKKNKTNRAGSAAGLSPYSWQNGKNRKRPKGVGAPMGQVNININYNPYYTV